jgi:hypothetical protein
LLDACNSLVLSHHRLAECLRTAGLINEQSALAVLAGEDQIDAAITHLRTLGVEDIVDVVGAHSGLVVLSASAGRRRPRVADPIPHAHQGTDSVNGQQTLEGRRGRDRVRRRGCRLVRG